MRRILPPLIFAACLTIYGIAAVVFADQISAFYRKLDPGRETRDQVRTSPASIRFAGLWALAIAGFLFLVIWGHA
jgi:hypothetical protein